MLFRSASWGYEKFGVGGLIAGGICGVFAGATSGVLVMAFAMLLGVGSEVLRHRRLLKPHFGRFWSRARRADWNKVKAALPAGTTVSGRAVAGIYHGMFVDIGCGFPARLGKHWAKDGFNGPQPQVGDAVTATVLNHGQFERVVDLTQQECSVASASPLRE